MTQPTRQTSAQTKDAAGVTGATQGDNNRQRRVATPRARFAACMGAALAALTALTALTALAPAAQAATDKAAAAPSAADCAAPRTQAQMNFCAEEDFLAANASYAEQVKALQKGLPAARHASLRRMQSTWLAYRTAACRFSSAPVAGGSAQGLIYWNCAARMTREHAGVLQAMAACREGDLACGRTRP